MLTLFEIAALLLALSALFSWLNAAFFKLPHTIGLLLIALVVSVLLIGLEAVAPNLGLADSLRSAISQVDFNETVMKGMLGFLLFAGALHVDFSRLKDAKWSIGIMASIGVLISTFIIGGGFWLITKLLGISIPFIWALVFGALISPTDPVAVLSILKTVKMPKALEAKIAGESLFNDGVGVVVFTIIVAIAVGTGGHGGEHIGAAHIAELFFVEAGGGAILGALTGWIAYRAMAVIDEHAIEILITIGIVAATYALAIRLHLSGPIAVVITGLMIGNKGVSFSMSEHTKDFLFGFWEMIDEILNSVLFLLIGLEILVIGFALDYFGVALLAIPLVLLARFVAVSVPIKALSPFKDFTKGAIPVLTWGGVRGGISVALALSLPENEYKPLILTATYGVVLFSIVIQGLTIKGLVQKVVDPKLL
ncbi:MAG: sodium:proton antiporter [Maricaulaceae bacterium]